MSLTLQRWVQAPPRPPWPASRCSSHPPPSAAGSLVSRCPEAAGKWSEPSSPFPSQRGPSGPPCLYSQPRHLPRAFCPSPQPSSAHRMSLLRVLLPNACLLSPRARVFARIPCCPPPPPPQGPAHRGRYMNEPACCARHPVGHQVPWDPCRKLGGWAALPPTAATPPTPPGVPPSPWPPFLDTTHGGRPRSISAARLMAPTAWLAHMDSCPLGLGTQGVPRSVRQERPSLLSTTHAQEAAAPGGHSRAGVPALLTC